MDVSVLVCTHNNARRLAATLDAIARCRRPQGLTWELVLVDNNCSDDTGSVAASFAARMPVRYVKEPRQGLSHARNAGVRAATGRLLVFGDDDITPALDWIVTYWRVFQERSDGYCFGGRVTPQFETAPPEPALLRLANLPLTGLDWGAVARCLEEHERFLGANWACPAAAVRRVGGFDVRLGLDASLGRRRVGEEWDLLERLRAVGIQPWYVPEAAVLHFVPAHKCSLPYIAGGWEAHGHYSALRGDTTTPFFRQRPHLRTACVEDGIRLVGVPWPAYVQAAWFALRWARARAAGGRGYEEYAGWRFCLGRIRGHRDRRREAAPRGRAPAATTTRAV